MALTWEDKEVKFDIPYSEMRLKIGEKIVDRLENIEDTKGNGGERGRLIVTNLRILWHTVLSLRINLSIGYNCITSVSTKVVNSKLRGTTQALHILTAFHKNRYEFIFTNLVPGNMRHFTSVMGVHKAYMSSKMYRELKLRGAVVYNKQLKMLPSEQIFTTIPGVWNLSSDQGSLGTFIVTNVRIVWFADTNEAFNISLPYLQVDNLKIRSSKFGMALVITSTERSGGYLLGFRVDPDEKLQTLFKELISLNEVYTNNPMYGVEYKWSTNIQRNENLDLNADFSGQVEDPGNEISNALNAYLADGVNEDRPPVYCQELGLAVESIKEGFTLKKLWEVIPQ